MELMFDVFDVNNDQKVDKKELLKLLSAVYEMQGKKEQAKDRVAQIFGTHDRDGSGALNKQEFIACMRQEQILKALSS
jgi:Ca2+-binding EF-hand superfamily protein